MERRWIGFFGKQFKSNGEKRRIWRTTRNLSPSACYRENNHCSMWRLKTQALYLEKFLMIALAQTFFIIQKNVTTLRVIQENNTVESTWKWKGLFSGWLCCCSLRNKWLVHVCDKWNKRPFKWSKWGLWGNLGSTSCKAKSWKSGSQSQQYFTDAPYHPLTVARVIPWMPSTLKVYVIK